MRPSIVSASVKEPYPGWVDNFNGETLSFQSMRSKFFGNDLIILFLTVCI